jgi:hypothetical protein
MDFPCPAELTGGYFWVQVALHPKCKRLSLLLHVLDSTTVRMQQQRAERLLWGSTYLLLNWGLRKNDAGPTDCFCLWYSDMLAGESTPLVQWCSMCFRFKPSFIGDLPPLWVNTFTNTSHPMSDEASHHRITSTSCWTWLNQGSLDYIGLVQDKSKFR